MNTAITYDAWIETAWKPVWMRGWGTDIINVQCDVLWQSGIGAKWLDGTSRDWLDLSEIYSLNTFGGTSESLLGTVL